MVEEVAHGTIYKMNVVGMKVGGKKNDEGCGKTHQTLEHHLQKNENERKSLGCH